MNTFKHLKTLGKIGILAMALAVASCSDDDDNGNGGVSGNADGFVKAKIDGTQFNSLEIQGISTVVAMRTGTGAQTLISVTGSSDSNNTINIAMMGITEEGTYQIGPDSDGSTLAYVQSGAQTSYDTSDCAGATGTIKVTKLTDTMVEGTFSFTGKVDEDCAQSKTITDGSFRGKFMNMGM